MIHLRRNISSLAYCLSTSLQAAAAAAETAGEERATSERHQLALQSQLDEASAHLARAQGQSNKTTAHAAEEQRKLEAWHHAEMAKERAHHVAAKQSQN